SKLSFWKNSGVRITWIGLLANVGLAIGKATGGIVFHSQALLADAVHSMSDLVSDILTLSTVSFGSKLPTEMYPYGHGKIETIGSLGVSAILLSCGISIGWASFLDIVGLVLPHMVADFFVSFQHLFDIFSHSHGAADAVMGHEHEITNINAAWIASTSIIIKESLYRATSKIAEETNSKVLLANAWHHRVDALTSVVVLSTITSGYLFNITCLDSIGGLLVSILIIKAGYQGARNSLFELIDHSIDSKDIRYVNIEDNLKEILDKLLSNNNSRKPYKISRLNIIGSGSNLIITDLKLVVPKQKWDNVLDIKEFENVSKVVKTKLIEKNPHIKKISIEFIEEEEVEEVEKEEVEEVEKEEGEEREEAKTAKKIE
ncbi:Mmt1p, partial [Ascoidea rubescens DSM 1968]